MYAGSASDPCDMGKKAKNAGKKKKERKEADTERSKAHLHEVESIVFHLIDENNGMDPSAYYTVLSSQQSTQSIGHLGCTVQENGSAITSACYRLIDVAEVREDTQHDTGLCLCAKRDLPRGTFLVHSIRELHHPLHAKAICHLRKIIESGQVPQELVDVRFGSMMTVAVTYDAKEICWLVTTMNTESSCRLLPVDEQVVNLIWQFVAEKSLGVWQAVAAMIECTLHEAFATFCAVYYTYGFLVPTEMSGQVWGAIHGFESPELLPDETHGMVYNDSRIGQSGVVDSHISRINHSQNPNVVWCCFPPFSRAIAPFYPTNGVTVFLVVQQDVKKNGQFLANYGDSKLIREHEMIVL